MQGLREVLLVQDTTSVNLETSRDVIREPARCGPCAAAGRVLRDVLLAHRRKGL